MVPLVCWRMEELRWLDLRVRVTRAEARKRKMQSETVLMVEVEAMIVWVALSECSV